jgi:hypothetical protein
VITNPALVIMPMYCSREYSFCIEAAGEIRDATSLRQTIDHDEVDVTGRQRDAGDVHMSESVTRRR